MMLHLWTQWRGEGGREGIKGGMREGQGEECGKKEEKMDKGKRAKE